MNEPFLRSTRRLVATAPASQHDAASKALKTRRAAPLALLEKLHQKKLFLFAVLALLLVGCVNLQQQNDNQTTFEPAPSEDLARAAALRTAKAGDTVKVDYVGSLENGTVFDTSIEAEAKKAGMPQRPSYEPLEFVLGSGQLIAGFDRAVVGMRVGQEKTVKLPPSEAYGEADPEAIVVVNRSQFGEEAGKLGVGTEFLTAAGPAKIIALNETHATVDVNHPLAGKTLVFRIIVREIKSA